MKTNKPKFLNPDFAQGEFYCIKPPIKIPKEMSGVYHVDEMVVHVRKEKIDKGHYQWLWNMMDNTTKFWISSKVSQRREVKDTRAVFQDAKSKSPTLTAIVYDGLQSYTEAYWREYFTIKGKKVKNIR